MECADTSHTARSIEMSRSQSAFRNHTRIPHASGGLSKTIFAESRGAAGTYSGSHVRGALGRRSHDRSNGDSLYKGF